MSLNQPFSFKIDSIKKGSNQPFSFKIDSLIKLTCKYKIPSWYKFFKDNTLEWIVKVY